MKAFQVTEIGQPARLVDVAAPKPGAGEVLVDIAACGLNFADMLMVEGKYQETPEPPFTLGMELAGTVAQVGPGVGTLKPGDRVAAFAGSGGFAETAAVRADRCVPLPDAMPFEHAAALPIAYGTSHLALERRARLQPGETLLVLGAAGGVGLTAVEIGKLMGARVIAVARGTEKLAVAEQAGADHLIDSGTADVRAEVKALGGADVVYDPVGGDMFTAAMRACKPEARIVVIGFASGSVPQIPANILLVKNLTAIGFYWGGYMAFQPGAVAGSLAKLFAWYGEGRLKPHVGATFPLERAQEALDMMRERRSTGKVLITPRG